MDFITKLLLVAGKDAILVVYDRLLKIAHFVTTIKRHWQKGWQDCLGIMYVSQNELLTDYNT